MSHENLEIVRGLWEPFKGVDCMAMDCGGEAIGDMFGRARALLALGVVRRGMRQRRAARETIEAALEGFEDCGAAGWAWRW